jgi:hypothetical protein
MTRRPWERGGRHLVAKFASTWASQGGRRRFLFLARHPGRVANSDVWKPQALIHVQKLVQREDCLAKIGQRFSLVRMIHDKSFRCGKFIVFRLS